MTNKKQYKQYKRKEESIQNSNRDSDENLHREILSLIEKNRKQSIKKRLKTMHAGDIADIIKLLNASQRRDFYKTLHSDGQIKPEILTYLDGELVDEIIDSVGMKNTTKAVSNLDLDDAVGVVEDLPEDTRREFVDQAAGKFRSDLEKSLAYPEDTAGRIMHKDFICAPEYWTVGNLIDYMRDNSSNLDSDFYGVFLISPKTKPLGFIMLGRIMRSKRSALLKNIMQSSLKLAYVNTDQEEVAYNFQKYGLVEMPVVNDNGQIIGSITVDDIVDVVSEEGEEDLLRLGGVSDGDLYSNIFSTVAQRFPWLFVNLLTAVIASIVIAYFDSVIQRLVILAVLMPIIASMGGNAGIQTLTVAVRALSLRELGSQNAWRVTFKELFIGLCNGIIFALIMGFVIVFFYKDVGLALIFAASTIFTFAIAGFSGILVPLIFNRLRIDPAIASGVILTMLTDVISFFSFLGMASLLLNAGH